jgi:hypothetical protein
MNQQEYARWSYEQTVLESQRRERLVKRALLFAAVVVAGIVWRKKP